MIYLNYINELKNLELQNQNKDDCQFFSPVIMNIKIRPYKTMF